MAHVLFWEKPGCGGNARQKALLRKAGHTLDVRDLLRWPWTRETLRPFLAPLPVPAWFNRAAPRIKHGEIAPDALDADAALTLLLADPLLIRRPLMQVGATRHVGFDAGQVHAWIGLGLGLDALALAPGTTLEGCAAMPHAHTAGHCTTPASTLNHDSASFADPATATATVTATAPVTPAISAALADPGISATTRTLEGCATTLHSRAVGCCTTPASTLNPDPASFADPASAVSTAPGNSTATAAVLADPGIPAATCSLESYAATLHTHATGRCAAHVSTPNPDPATAAATATAPVMPAVSTAPSNSATTTAAPTASAIPTAPGV